MRNQRRFVFSLLFIAFLQLFFTQAILAAVDSSSCVTCHTNESLIKSLYKAPPLLHAEEGEG
ncbi:MAG: hypothetical protein FD159_1764 [Syntrophaceae bacterium]|nr:MAG: hypothetical protein FD159_1764 [Syntrophaceae bacterium]